MVSSPTQLFRSSHVDYSFLRDQAVAIDQVGNKDGKDLDEDWEMLEGWRSCEMKLNNEGLELSLSKMN